MGDPMEGIEANVEFSEADATALKTACTSAATQILFQQGSRTSWAQTALTDFKGHFSQLFATNATTAYNDSTELITALNETRDVGRQADHRRQGRAEAPRGRPGVEDQARQPWVRRMGRRPPRRR